MIELTNLIFTDTVLILVECETFFK